MNFAQHFLNNDVSKPLPDEIEISVFGAGIGEAIVVHMGDGQWLTVDSLLVPETETSVASMYLKTIGVALDTAVARVVVTHWHDDHIAGVSELFNECKAAKLVASACLVEKDFLILVQAQKQHRPVLKRTTTGSDEMSRALEFATERSKTNPGSVVFVMNNQRVYQSTGGSIPSEILALSPSSEDFKRTLEGFVRLMPRVRSSKTRLPRPKPNDSCVALWTKLDTISLLLGSDLEASSAPNRGWNAVCGLNPPVPSRSTIFKIPHHGSSNAHHDKVWADLLHSKPLSILTPYSPSKLPKPEDMDRVLALTADAYLASSQTRQVKVGQRDPAVTRTVRETTKQFRSLDTKLGMVRVRMKKGSSPAVALFGAASTLKDHLTRVRGSQDPAPMGKPRK